jgi:hypothetical protein
LLFHFGVSCASAEVPAQLDRSGKRAEPDPPSSDANCATATAVEHLTVACPVWSFAYISLGLSASAMGTVLPVFD